MLSRMRRRSFVKICKHERDVNVGPLLNIFIGTKLSHSWDCIMRENNQKHDRHNLVDDELTGLISGYVRLGTQRSGHE